MRKQDRILQQQGQNPQQQQSQQNTQQRQGEPMKAGGPGEQPNRPPRHDGKLPLPE